LLSLIQYICYTPSNPKWLRCAWNSNFISNYAHIYMELTICIVVSLTTLDPISLGAKMYLNVVLGTLEMQWILVSFIRKVLPPYDYWSQARMIGELLSTTSHHCYLGNNFFHAYFSIIPTLIGCILAWKYSFANIAFLQRSYKEISLLHMWASWDDCIWWGVYKIMFMIH
jgi:hypothetical protein